MAHRSLPPFLAGVLQSVGITAALVAFGLAWASLYNVGAFSPYHLERIGGIGAFSPYHLRADRRDRRDGGH